MYTLRTSNDSSGGKIVILIYRAFTLWPQIIEVVKSILLLPPSSMAILLTSNRIPTSSEHVIYLGQSVINLHTDLF